MSKQIYKSSIFLSQKSKPRGKFYYSEGSGGVLKFLWKTVSKNEPIFKRMWKDFGNFLGIHDFLRMFTILKDPQNCDALRGLK